MNLEIVKYKITGDLPLLTKNAANMKIGRGVKIKEIPTPEEEAKSGLYIDEEGNYCVTPIMFRQALLLSLSNKKVGKKPANIVFAAAVFTVGEYCPLIDPDTEESLKDYEIDIRRAVVQRQGVMRARPKFNKWGCKLFLQIDKKIISEQQVLEELNEAGITMGIGDYRIGRKGMFGRFHAELEE